MIDDLKNYRSEQDDFAAPMTDGELAILLACVMALGFILATVSR